ncbi:MAG: thiol reductant ABC exporter subunit CydD [Marinobacter sp.]
MGEPLTPAAGQWLRQRQRPARGSVRAAVVAGFAAAVAAVVQFGGMAWIAHSMLTADAPPEGLPGWAALVLLAIAVRAVSVSLQNRFAADASNRIRALLRRDLLARFRHLGPVRLGQSSSGTLASEWLDQVEALHGYFAHYLPQMALSVAVPLLILVVVFWLDWLAALFLLLSAPLIPLFMALVGMGAEKLNQQHMETLGRLSGHFLDRLRGLTTLQLFQYTPAAAREIAAVTHEYRRINMKTLRVAFLSSAVLEFFASVAIAVVAIYIGFGLLGYIDYGPSGDLTLFSGLFILLLAPEFFQPLRQLAQHYHDRAAALGAAAQLRHRLDGEDQMEAVQQEDTVVSTPVAVEVDGAAVTFPDGRTGLEPISLTVRPGELVALEGPSGAGKSTLLHLLAGFIRPDSGQVRVFGKLAGNDPIGWLGQTPFIRQDTWAGNLRLAAPGATDKQLMEALERVGLLQLLQQRSQGLNTPLAEGGIGLSGGRARRLAVARLYLAHFPLVLMDEPTAGLDARSEQHLIDAILALRAQGSTIVMASHHPAVLAAADRRLVLARGRLQHD